MGRRGPKKSRKRTPKKSRKRALEELYPSGVPLGGEHVKNARPSTEEKHEKGQARKRRDKGGEKGDDYREY
jgi:hypothetical protein